MLTGTVALKEDDLALMTLLSDQLAIAVTNANLYHDALDRVRFRTSLTQLGITLTASLDVEHLIDALCHESLSIFGVDSAVLFLRPEITNPSPYGTHVAQRSESVFVCRAAAGAARAELLDITFPSDQASAFLNTMLHRGRGLVVHAAAQSNQVPVELQNALPAQALMAIPLTKEREIIGILILADTHNANRFDEGDLVRGAIVASQAALALANARP